MKKQIFKAVLISIILMNVTLLLGQSSGTLWIGSFRPGSSDLDDSTIDKVVLAKLDSLMQDRSLEVTFLGAADSLGWKLNGSYVHEHVSEAWNDAKRLSRARALRARYGRGTIGVTHESVAGVKVVWSRTGINPEFTKAINELKRQNADLEREVANLKREPQVDEVIPGTNGTNGYSAHITEVKEEGLTFNWRLQAGMWTWQSGSGGNILSPAVGLNIIVGKTAFLFQGGVTPWHSSSPFGNKSESFVYTGVKYFKTDRVGLTLGAFRGWEFFTETDNWSFKTTGLAAGVVLSYGVLELSPTLTYSSISTIETARKWRFGSIIGLNLNIN